MATPARDRRVRADAAMAAAAPRRSSRTSRRSRRRSTPRRGRSGNFRDALAAGYSARVGERDGRIVAYGVLMLAPGEAQLLNLSVVPMRAAQGLGRALLRRFVDDARSARRRAALPRSARIERRRDRAVRVARDSRRSRAASSYYPGRHAMAPREDALVMRRAVDARPDAAVPMATRDEILRELGLAPTWRRRAAPARRAPAASRRRDRARACAPAHRAERRRSARRAHRRARLARLRRRRRRVHRLRAVPHAQEDRCPAWATSDAEWLFVGEAPGAEEDARGEPFVGQAGQLLDNMLAALGMTRGENVYIANVLKCRPPNNRTPEPREVDACRPYLDRQIALIAPEADRRARQERRDDAPRHRRDDREPARARPPLSRRAAGRHLSSGLPAAQPARQGEGVGGSAASRGARCATPQPPRRRRADVSPPRRRIALASAARSTPSCSRRRRPGAVDLRPEEP